MERIWLEKIFDILERVDNLLGNGLTESGFTHHKQLEVGHTPEIGYVNDTLEKLSEDLTRVTTRSMATKTRWRMKRLIYQRHV